MHRTIISKPKKFSISYDHQNRKILRFQIGKNGLTDGVIASLSLALKHHKQVRVSVLKSATRNREELEKMALGIVEKLPINSEYKLIGYTIILFKKGKPKKIKSKIYKTSFLPKLTKN